MPLILVLYHVEQIDNKKDKNLRKLFSKKINKMAKRIDMQKNVEKEIQVVSYTHFL